MKRAITKRPAAQRDLVGHFAFIAQDSLQAAERFLKATEAFFGQLAQMPQLGRIRDCQDARLAGLRFSPIPRFTNYIVFYRPTDNGIDVIRVLHGARDIDTILEVEGCE